nr:sodium-coupled monocarboxylate transporter 1-like isoform X2 [Biomphalaria glabrata]
MSTNTGPRSPIYYGGYSFNTGKVRQFQVVDYTMFAAVLILSGAIGMYHAINDRKKKTLEQFFLAGKDMNPVPVGLSMLASFMPAITFLGLPAEIYTYNIMSVWIGLSYFFVMAVAAHVYMPIFYHLQVTSCFQYLEKRFSRGVRSAASLCFVVHMVVYMSVVLYAPSLALNAVTGFTLWGSVLSVGAVSTVYTALGGMKAVLWTDTFQVFVILSSLIVLLMKGQHAVGGVMAAWGSIERTDRAEYLELGLYPSVRHSVWSLVIGGLFSWLPIFGVNQNINGETSVGEASVGETSVGEASVGEASVGETSVGDTSVGETSVGEASVGETSVGETSVGETSVGETSVVETSVGEASVGETSVGETSVGETSVGDTSVGETSVGEASVGESSVGETSVGEASVG